MKNLLVRILALVLVLTMAFAFAACKAEEEEQKPTQGGTTGGGGFTWGDIGGDEGGEIDPPVDPGDEWDPWDEVKYFAVPNTKATINVITADTKNGFKADNGFVSEKENAVGALNISLAEGSKMVFEYTYSGSVKAGVKFAVNEIEVAAPAEGEDATVAYEGLYVFVAADGKLNIAKIDADGETVLATSTAKVSNNAKIVIDWNGKDTVSVKVNGAASATANNIALAKASGAVEIVADAAGAKFSAMKATLEGTAIEFETRAGTTWEVVTEGDHEGSFYTGYAGNSASNYKTLALVNNIDFAAANKITISGMIAIGKDWRKVDSKTGKFDNTNQNTGFIVSHWNVNGTKEDTSPLFWETANNSFIKVAISGNGLAPIIGKWGKTEFTSSDCNKEGKWHTFCSKCDMTTLADAELNAETGKALYSEIAFDYGDYYELKVVWDAENFALTTYIGGYLVKSYKFNYNIFEHKDGSGVGIMTNSGDAYFREIQITVE